MQATKLHAQKGKPLNIGICGGGPADHISHCSMARRKTYQDIVLLVCHNHVGRNIIEGCCGRIGAGIITLN